MSNADTDATVSVSLGDLTTLHAMARTVDKKNVNAHGRDVLSRTGSLIQTAWNSPDVALTQEMLGRLYAAGIRTRSAAMALSIDERDKVLDVAAWGGDEDGAWEAALKMLRLIDGDDDAR